MNYISEYKQNKKTRREKSRRVLICFITAILYEHIY